MTLDLSETRSIIRGTAVIAISLAFAASGAQAAEQQGATATPGTGFYVFGGLAALAAEKNDRLQGENGSPINLIFGGGYRFTPGLAIELGPLFSIRDLDTPPSAAPPAGTFRAGTLESAMATFGLSATLKYHFTAGRFMPYVGGGLGWYRTQFRTTSEAVGCFDNCSNTGPSTQENSTDIGYHALVGGDYHFTKKHAMSAEVRYLKLKADFPTLIPGGDVDVGGVFFWMGYRYFFQ